ncbi:AI-2E family transporter [Propioniciclava coleopterorum]|uniref:AI-2E family transporter n=1 Tax=Propioniciclava coleopterorum TaxID=2714937 RepID=A0A6G7Y8R4_9ACTN|nr:AI-2E family transporter [Propioniciclava coleopterorum]QIK73007.1 AI-2E family transporter [Propioniciclava coleopterorum]
MAQPSDTAATPPRSRRVVIPAVTTILLTLTCALVVLFGMHQYADIIGPLMLTLNLFIAAYPIQTLLIRKGVPKLLAQIILAIVVFAILSAFFFALVWSITALVQELPQYQRQFWTLYHQTVSWLSQFGISEQQVLDQLKTLNPASFTGILTSALGSVTNIVTMLTVIIVMIFMMAFDTDTFGGRNDALKRYQPRIWHSIADFIAGVRRYWVVSTIFGLIVAIIDVIALEFLNVPLALVWGILAFLTNYIPNVGFVIGLVPPAIMALLANDPLTALLVVIIYSVVNFVIQSIIQPKFNGDAVGVTALVSFLSLLLWSSVIGALGALLALPMTLLAKAILVDHDPQMRWLNAFISNDPAMADPRVPASDEDHHHGTPASRPAAPDAVPGPAPAATDPAADADGSPGSPTPRDSATS